MPKAIGNSKVCTGCRSEKSLSEFRKNRCLPDGYNYYCKECLTRRFPRVAQKDAIREKQMQRAWYVNRNYGMTEEEYIGRSISQQFVCAICKRPSISKATDLPRRLDIDHNHDSGKIRGLLCRSCNLGIGHLATPTRLRLAADYMETADAE